MNRLPLTTNIVGEGLSWLVVSAPYDEALVAEEEARFSAECKKLFYPETAFKAPGIDRKDSEEDEDVRSCESSDYDTEEFPELDSQAI
jgi:hypothetical protein